MFLRLVFSTLFFCSLSLAAQPICVIDAQNANQDFCTACSTGGNNAIQNGRFEGDLYIDVSYTIDATCLASITWGGAVYFETARNASLTFAADPRVEVGTTVTADYAHHRHSGAINAYGLQYFPRGNPSYTDFAAQMEATAGTFRSNLPIELLDWRAKRDGSQVTLSWTTAREQNNDYFEVAYSTDGTAFTPVATLAGVGTTNYEQHYSTTHRPTASGAAYYRLRQVDLDGTVTVAEVLTVAAGSITAGSIYPNPAPAGAVLTVGSTPAATNVVLYDLRGRAIRTYALTGTQLALPRHLAAGTYLLRVGTHSQYVVVH